MDIAPWRICGEPVKLSYVACDEDTCKDQPENGTRHVEVCGEADKLLNDACDEETCKAKLDKSNRHSEQLTKPQLEAHNYLKEKKISELFNFLIGHLLADEPLDPIGYLSDLLDKCILFRSGLREPPLLFTSRHVTSMYHSLDTTGAGTISFNQFKAGMTALGICCYETYPNECNPERVGQETFEIKAKTCLEKMLKEMVGNIKE